MKERCECAVIQWAKLTRARECGSEIRAREGGRGLESVSLPTQLLWRLESPDLMGGGLAIESRAILMTLGQYLHGKKSNVNFFLNVIETCLRYGKCGRKTIIARTDFLKQMVAPKGLHRNNYLRFDLRSTVMAPEVSNGQWPYCRLGDSR